MRDAAQGVREAGRERRVYVSITSTESIDRAERIADSLRRRGFEVACQLSMDSPLVLVGVPGSQVDAARATLAATEHPREASVPTDPESKEEG